MTVPAADAATVATGTPAVSDLDTNTGVVPAADADKNANAKGESDGNSQKEREARYHISREREGRIKAEKRAAELEKQLNTPAPKFDETNDPDGKKQRAYEIEKAAQDIVDSRLKDLGLEEKLEKLEIEKEREQFFNSFEEPNAKLKSLGFEPPTKEAIQADLKRLDTQGISSDDLAWIAVRKQVMEKLAKPDTYTPGNGGKPNTDAWSPKTNADVIADVFRTHGMFGYK
jgi:hypothetical protein